MDLQAEVERRIEECRRSRSLQLDLSDCGLTELPSPVFELIHITSLKLGTYRSSESSTRNQIRFVPNKIESLQNLRILDLRSNQLSTLPEKIIHLQNLEQLYLNSNKFSTLPEVLTHLQNLQQLYLRSNQLSTLPETIARLQNLQQLYLSSNQFSVLPEAIVGLQNLQILDLSYNQLIILSEAITHLEKLQELDLSSNKLEDPPQEVAKQGVVAVRKYFEEKRRSNEDTLFEAKLLLVGEGRVGKTSLAQSLQFDDFMIRDEQSTQGIDIQSWIIPKEETGLVKDFRLNVWDFGGQAIYHQTHQFFLTKRSLYLLVTESRRDNQNDDFYYWLNIIRLLADNCPVILALNKCDQPTKLLPINEYQAAFENLVEFHQVSCHSSYKNTLVPLRKAIQRIITNPKLMPHVGSKLPGVWVQIREELAKLREAGKDFISRDDYLVLCARHHMDEKSADLLSSFFHDIGVFLHFRDDSTLCETVILDHEWMTAGVYRVLDSQGIIDQEGQFSEADLIAIWGDKKYRHKRAELRSLMTNPKFELVYNVAGGYIAPQLLPVDEITYEWRSYKGNLNFEYRYKFMPKGILTRFIVKRHKDIFRETHWRYGVLLEWEDTRALVRERYFERKITIQLEGFNQRGFLAIIRKTIDEIHATFNNLEVLEMIPCNCIEYATGDVPHFFDYATLCRYLSKRVGTIRCDKSIEEVDIHILLSEVIMPEHNRYGDYYHIEGDYIGNDKVGGDKVGGDKIDADIENSANVVVGKRSRGRSGS